MTGLFLRNRPELDAVERDKAVAVRLQRQSLLTRRLPPAPDLTVVLGEAVLRRPVLDRSVMAGQARHLLDVTELRTVSVRVLPLSVGPPLASEAGSFVILDFAPMPNGGAAEPTTIYIEGLTGALYLDKPSEVAAYEHVWAGTGRSAYSNGGEFEDVTAEVVTERACSWSFAAGRRLPLRRAERPVYSFTVPGW